MCSSDLRELFARRLGSNNSRLGTFNQQVALELGHRGDRLHGHFTGRTGQIDAAQRKVSAPKSN